MSRLHPPDPRGELWPLQGELPLDLQGELPPPRGELRPVVVELRATEALVVELRAADAWVVERRTTEALVVELPPPRGGAIPFTRK